MGPRRRACVVAGVQRVGPLVALVGATAIVIAAATAALPAGDRDTTGLTRGIAPGEARTAAPGPFADGAAAPGRGRPAPGSAAAGTPAAQPAAAPAPPRSGSDDSLTGAGARFLLGALVLAGLLLAAVRYAHRLPLARLLPSADGPIRVIGRAHLAPKGAVVLLQVERRAVLVAVTPSAIQPLHAWDVPVEADGTTLAAPGAVTLPGQLRGLEARLGRGRG